MNDTDRGLLEAFLASIGGMAGRFTVWPHYRPGGSGYTPLVNGTMSNFKQLPTKSWPTSRKVLRAGDFLAVGAELKMVTADVFSDAGGLALVPVAPAFRAAPANNTSVVLDKPRATMMLASDEYSVAVLPGRISDSVVINAVETFS